MPGFSTSGFIQEYVTVFMSQSTEENNAKTIADCGFQISDSLRLSAFALIAPLCAPQGLIFRQ
jgi:hypothetical protein